MYYDPSTQILCINDQRFNIDAAYHYKGVYYLKAKTHHFNFITDGDIILGCHNFISGRKAFIRYKRFRNLPPHLTFCSYTDKLNSEEGLALYKLAVGMCKEGGEDFLVRKNIQPDQYFSIQEIIEMTKGEYRAEEFADYFITEETLPLDQLYKDTIPGMEPPNFEGEHHEKNV